MTYHAFAIGQAASVLKGGVQDHIAGDPMPWYNAILEAERYLYAGGEYMFDREFQSLRTPSRSRAGLVHKTTRRRCSCLGKQPFKPCLHRPLLSMLLILTACDDEARSHMFE